MAKQLRQLARRAGWATVLTAVIAMIWAGSGYGSSGALSSAVAIALVLTFIGTTALVLTRIADYGPQALGLAALGLYAGKVILLGGLAFSLGTREWFRLEAFAWTVLAMFLAWTITLSVTAIRTRREYFSFQPVPRGARANKEPDGV